MSGSWPASLHDHFPEFGFFISSEKAEVYVHYHAFLSKTRNELNSFSILAEIEEKKTYKSLKVLGMISIGFQGAHNQ
jgi:hypothetical protein